MEQFLLGTLMFLFFVSNLVVSVPAMAESTPAKSKYSEDYEEDATDKKVKKELDGKETFTDKVKSVRSVDGEYDVFFVEHFGPYSVPFSFPNSKNKELSPEVLLNQALKSGSPITVTVDSKTDTLMDIEASASRSAASTTPPKYEFPPGMEYLRDIMKGASKP